MNLQNIINSEKYIISQELQEVLLKDNWAHESRVIVKDLPGVYLVMFRVLNNDSKTLVYNYIYYNNLLEQCVLYYIRSTQYSPEYREIGTFLSVIDEQFFKDKINKLCMCVDTPSYQKIEKSNFKDHYELLNLITKLIYIADYETMSKLLEFAYSDDYSNFIRLILKTIPRFDVNKKFELSSFNRNKSISIINASLFVVHDVSRLIKHIKALGFNVNQGPQPWRGQINSISSFLNSFDLDFRNSLYNHNKYHVEKGTISLQSQIARSKFSFKNIHMNLGTVRWYSTKTRNLVAISENKTLVNSYKTSCKTNLIVPDYLHEIIIGSMLGDLSAEKPNKNCNTRLQFKQSLMNKKYIEHTYALFKEYCGTKPLIMSKYDPRVNKLKVYSAVKFQTLSLSCFNIYKQLFYDTAGKKIVPLNIEQLLTNRGLTYWFMDDGYKSLKGFYICTESFSLSEIELLVNVLINKFGLRSSYHKTTNGYRIYIAARSQNKLTELIKPFLLEHFYYKLNLTNDKYS